MALDLRNKVVVCMRNFVEWSRRLKAIGRDEVRQQGECVDFYGSARWVTRSDGGSENGYIAYLRRKLYVDVTWEVVYRRKRYPSHRQYQHNVNEVGDEHDKNPHVGIVQDDRDTP